MNHKRRRPKKLRAGCAMCKPWKQNGAKDGREQGKRPPSERRKLQDDDEGAGG